jgi:hypothetical protein
MSKWVAGIFVVLLSASAGAEQAPTEDEAARQTAKQLRDDGARALDAGHPDEALGLFRRAYETYPKPNMLFNIGLALDALERRVEALDAFELFLLQATDAPPEARRHAAEQIAALTSAVGHLAVTVDVDGAEVEIDGQKVGTTPLPRVAHLAPGLHALRVSHANYNAEERQLTVAAGQTVRLTVHLRPVAPTPAPAPLVAQPTHKQSPPRASRWWLWTLVGVLSAGAVAGVVAGAVIATNPSGPKVDLGTVPARF